MGYIKLECKYKKFKYGEVVEIGKNTITEEEAKQLIKDKAASLYVKPVLKGNDTNSKALEEKVKKLEAIVIEAIASPKDKAPASWEEYLSSRDK